MRASSVILITQNPGKIKSAQSIFNKLGIKLETTDNDYPEIQADTSLEIAKYTALKTAQDLNKPTIREDHSLYISSLGIPGPYTSFIEKKIPADKLLKLLKDQADRSGYFELAAVYAEPSGFTKEFVYQVPIHIKLKEIVKDPRGGGWNGVLCLKREERAFTEYPEEQRLDVWNKNYKDIAKFLSEN